MTSPVNAAQPEPELTKLGRAHLDDTWGVIQRCSQWLAAQGLTHWQDYYTREIVAEKIDSGSVVGLCRGRSLLAVVSLSTETPQYFMEILQAQGIHASAETAYLSMLATEPSLHAKGMGSKLLERCEELARRAGRRAIHIDVLGSYAALNQFYLRRGYELLVSAHDGDEQMNFYRKNLSKD